MLELQTLPSLYEAYRTRYNDRDLRYQTIDNIVKGIYDAFDSDEQELLSSSPNMVQVALEDTAEAASLVPTIRVTPSRAIETVKKQAQKMEKIAANYARTSNIDLMIPQTIMDLAAFGLGCYLVYPDYSQKLPVIERRDPRTCYPEPGHRPGDKVKRAMFVREVYLSQLPMDYQIKVSDFIDETKLSAWKSGAPSSTQNLRVLLVEYFDCEEFVVAAMYEGSAAVSSMSPSARYTPVELERVPNKTGVCPVVVGARFSLDGDFRGQFDQVVDVLKAHVRLQALLLDYADQAVYSDVWVKDLIGELSFGGGAYIELGPQGAIGRVPPAVSSLNVQQDLANLSESFHLGSRWPKSRPGQVDQAIASAKFVEATAGVMNTAIRSYHTINADMWEKALQIAFEIDRMHFPGPKTMYGVLRNQEFLDEYDTKEINPDCRVRCEYGIGFGRDPANSAVLGIQYSQNEFVSRQSVMENIEGVTDVSREMARIDSEKFEKMMFAKLLQGVEAGAITDRQLLELARHRAEGAALTEIYEKYVVKPAEEASTGMMSGLMPGQQIPPPGGPGAPPSPGGPGSPQAPGVPPAPEPSQILNRLGVQVPGTGMLGSQIMTGGGR